MLRRGIITETDTRLKQMWLERFRALPPEARSALRGAQLDLRADSAQRAEHCWNQTQGTDGALSPRGERLHPTRNSAATAHAPGVLHHPVHARAADASIDDITCGN